LQAQDRQAIVQFSTLKLTLVTETFPPEVNGVSMTLGRLVEGLHLHGTEVTVVAPGRKDREPGQRPDHTLACVRGLPIPRYTELRFGLPAHARLRRLWRRQRPDLVHIATEGPLGWSALRVARQGAIPVVSSFHTNFHSYGSHYGFSLLKPLVLAWLRRFHNRTLCTFVPSTDVMAVLGDAGFANLRLLARGVDTALYGPHRRDTALRESWGAGPDTPVALYVGRLAGEKNLDLVVDAWRAMRASLPELKLVLVGDGPDRARLQRAVPEAAFAGMRRGEDLARHYASADAFLFASTTETFGNVVTEAMASGLAVLAYDYAAPGRFIASPVNGLLAPFNDRSAFLQQAVRLAGMRDQWAALGRAARETILPHSWDSVVSAYLKEIESIQA
jgi:glycosyltransferase involved in cell wall biosynthesis